MGITLWQRLREGGERTPWRVVDNRIMVSGSSEGEQVVAQVDTQRFTLDIRGESQSMTLRKAAAWLALFSGAWLLTLPYAIPRAFAVAGLGFAVLWLAGSIRTQRILHSAHQHFLEIDATGIGLCEGGEPIRVPWQEVQSVAIDHDRLHIVVMRNDAPDLVIEPRYQGISLQELAQTLSHGLARGRGDSAQNQSRGALGTQDG